MENKIGIDENHLQNIQGVLDEAVLTNKFAGCSCLVCQGGKERGFWASGFAQKDREKPFARDTICRIFSMTKPITAVSAWILVEKGKIDLASPVSDFLSDFSALNVLSEGKIVPCQKSLLVRDLLNMTSGYSYGGLQDESHRQISALIVQIDEAIRRGEPLSLAKIVSRAAKIPLAFNPGESFEYGISADILGAVIESVSGMKLGDFMKKEIFEPLSMHDTAFFVPSEKKSRAAAVYEQVFSDGKRNLRERTDGILGIELLPEKTPAFESGGAGLWSTVDDYMKFCRMLLAGGKAGNGRILQSGTIRSMHTLHISGDAQRAFEEKLPQFSGYSYGNLMRILTDESKSSTISRGNGEFGWDGALGTYMAVDSENDLAIVFFTQCANDGGYTSTARKIKNVVYSALTA